MCQKEMGKRQPSYNGVAMGFYILCFIVKCLVYLLVTLGCVTNVYCFKDNVKIYGIITLGAFHVSFSIALTVWSSSYLIQHSIQSGEKFISHSV